MNPIPRFVFRRNVADSGVQSESGILFQKAHSMRSNPEDGLFRGECFPGPEILGGIVEKERVVHRGVGEIENPDCTSAIGERLAVDAAGTCGFHSGFRCENILVDGDDVIVGEQLEGLLMEAIISAMARPASTSPPMVFKRTRMPAMSQLRRSGAERRLQRENCIFCSSGVRLVGL